MKSKKANVLSRLSVIMIVVMFVMLLAACAGEPAAAVDPTAAVEEETVAPILVTMPDYEFTYSGDMADVISINERDGSNELEFVVKTSQAEYTIFVLRINAEEGDLVEFIPDAKGNKIPVAFDMTELPEGLSDDDQFLFYQAQERVNDIVASIKLK